MTATSPVLLACSHPCFSSILIWLNMPVLPYLSTVEEKDPGHQDTLALILVSFSMCCVVSGTSMTLSELCLETFCFEILDSQAVATLTPSPVGPSPKGDISTELSYNLKITKLTWVGWRSLDRRTFSRFHPFVHELVACVQFWGTWCHVHTLTTTHATQKQSCLIPKEELPSITPL